jgi:hypothetical protein
MRRRRGAAIGWNKREGEEKGIGRIRNWLANKADNRKKTRNPNDLKTTAWRRKN